MYFGWGNGVSDRASYLEATAEFERWKAARLADAERTTASAAGRHLQHELSMIDVDESWVDIPRARQRIEQLEKVGTHSGARFTTIVDGVEKRRLIASLGDLSLDEIRRAFAPPPPVEAPTTKTTRQLLEKFVDAQRVLRASHIHALMNDASNVANRLSDAHLDLLNTDTGITSAPSSPPH